MDTLPPSPSADLAHLDMVCSLDDPNRRRLYDYVVTQGHPVTRDHAAAALGLERSTAAYHLDKLVDGGLLAASFARPDGRGGPGAGRPAKHYERSSREFGVSVPPRDYELAADLLARAVEADQTGTVRDALERAAADIGREAATSTGSGARDLLDDLTARGFEPYRDGDDIRLRNCPFHRLAQAHTELICGMNLALLTSLAESADASFHAELDPAPDRCCVTFTRHR